MDVQLNAGHSKQSQARLDLGLVKKFPMGSLTKLYQHFLYC